MASQWVMVVVVLSCDLLAIHSLSIQPDQTSDGKPSGEVDVLSVFFEESSQNSQSQQLEDLFRGPATS